MADEFESLASIEPDRGDEDNEEVEIPEVASATQIEKSSPNDSDLQTLMKRLLPFCDNEDIQRIAPFITMGRVFPDNFSTKIYMLVCNYVEKHSDDPTVDVWEIETIYEGLCQMGLKGFARAEVLVGAGNVKKEQVDEIGRSG